MLTDKDREKIAVRAARRYAYLKWIDIEEAKQEALLAILEAERTFAAHGTQGNLHGYATRAAQYAVRWHVWSLTSPLKHTDRGSISREVVSIRRADDSETLLLPTRRGNPERALSHARWAASVRARFDALVAKDAECDQSIARRVLLNDEDSEAVAQAEEVPVRAVYVVTNRVRARILKDEEMLALLLERCED